jgi:transposase
VVESAGGLQRRLVRTLQEVGHSVSVVNPERIWAYRRLVGRVAKTDRIDARLIAEYGATMRPAPSVPLGEAQQAMRELTSRRDQPIEAITAEKKRLRRVSQEAVRASLELQIAFPKQEVRRIEAAIEEAVSKDEATQRTRSHISKLHDHAGADGFFESEVPRPFGVNVIVQPHGKVERPLEVRLIDDVRDNARIQEALIRVQ